jgi:hypothetical protein
LVYGMGERIAEISGHAGRSPIGGCATAIARL